MKNILTIRSGNTSPPPPKARRKMPIAPYFDRLDLMGEIFINSPATEPMPVSARRLVDAITADGIFDTLSPASVWYTYRHHPELSKSLTPKTP